MRALLLLITLSFPSFLLLCQPVVINEFSSNNEDNIMDKDGDNSDWIEIYNPGVNAVNLLGYTLSDKEDDLSKWSFPDVNLNAKDILIVFASGKDTIYQNELHTNFKIKNTGEHIILADDLGVILDQIPPVSLNEDVSYGRFPNGAGSFFFFDIPTPFSSNQESIQTISSHQSGYYTQPFLLELHSPSNQTTIHYTTDGSDPTVESPVYGTPILIDYAANINEGLSYIPTTPLEPIKHYTWQTPVDSVYKISVIKYLNFKNGDPVGAVQARTFIINSQAADRYTLPIISIIMDEDDLVGYENGIYVPGKKFDKTGWVDNNPKGNYSFRGLGSERPFHLHYLKPNGEPGLGLAAGLRIHGSYTRRFPQKGMKFYFREEYGKNKIEYPLFGEESTSVFKRLFIKSSDLTGSIIRNYFIQKTQGDTQVDGQKSQFVIVFINGEYWGIFTLQERQDKYYIKYKHDVEEDNVIITNACGTNDEGIKEPLHKELMDFARATNWSTSESFNQLGKRIDVDNFIDYMIVQLFIANKDWPGNNYKMWRSVEKESKWRWLLYDLDNTFGLGNATIDFNSIYHNTQVNSTHWTNPDCSTLLFRAAISNQEFQNLFLDRFSEALNTTFSSHLLLSQIEEIRLQILPEILEHIERWGLPKDVDSWENAIEELRMFAKGRPCRLRAMILNLFKLEEADFNFNDNCSFDREGILFPSYILYPNPTSGFLQLEFKPEKHHFKGQVEVYLPDGRFIEQGDISYLTVNKISLDLSDLENGMYILRFPTFEGQLSMKLTILK